MCMSVYVCVCVIVDRKIVPSEAEVKRETLHCLRYFFVLRF
jgi:hypothetical protein